MWFCGYVNGRIKRVEWKMWSSNLFYCCQKNKTKKQLIIVKVNDIISDAMNNNFFCKLTLKKSLFTSNEHDTSDKREFLVICELSGICLAVNI